MVLWWISGGTIGLIQLAYYYCCEMAIAASKGGMQAVAAMPGWSVQIARNPKNKQIILAQDPVRFIETMERWAEFYFPSKTSPVPGMSPADFARLRMPTLIYRSGLSDLSHTRKTSEWVHELMPQSKIVEPPWGDTEWNSRSGTPSIFEGWPALAPAILEFTR
jgi:hypothetical protein